MFPLHDDIQPRTFPWVTYMIIGLCSMAFVAQMVSGPNGEQLVEEWGMIPARVLADEAQERQITVERPTRVDTPFGPQIVHQIRPLVPAAVSDWLTLFTCMFLHGGLLHFAGNMWFLHIFGDNVEDRFGHVLYVTLYLGAGLVAGLAHLVSDPDSLIPTIGASGAIAGVMGAYVLLYPKAVVETIIPLPFLFTTFSVPAPVFLGVWFVMQLLHTTSNDAASEGVAWWAHIGGFIAGMAAAGFLMVTQVANPPVEEHRPLNFAKPPRPRF